MEENDYFLSEDVPLGDEDDVDEEDEILDDEDEQELSGYVKKIANRPVLMDAGSYLLDEVKADIEDIKTVASNISRIVTENGFNYTKTSSLTVNYVACVRQCS
jgi:hypothetical protein